MVDDGLLRVPYRDLAGREHNVKFFSSAPRHDGSWWERPEREPIPFGLEQLQPLVPRASRTSVVLVRGEANALALRAWFTEGAVLGLPDATWRREWKAYLSPFPMVYAVADGDEISRELAARIKRDLSRVRVAWLPDGSNLQTLLSDGRIADLAQAVVEADRQARSSATFVRGDVGALREQPCREGVS